MTPKSALLFAAGLGTRMRPLTDDRPKPLIPVAGKPLLQHALAMLDDPRIERRVVNAHYKADQIEAALAGTNIQVSDERDALLETGGGLKRALPLLGGGCVVTMNTDAIWTRQTGLQRLFSDWRPAKMDALLLLVPRHRAHGHLGKGDFLIGADGELTPGPGDVYTGLQIIKTDPFTEIRQDAFSMWEVWTPLLEQGRVFGTIYDGDWCDVGQPESIAIAEAMLRTHS